ncbi:penicillin-binding transpeptidase domain-containing protein [Actinomadura sp. NPDC047616]|uniref:penicillin-binding transpeptidase domain-containing protein n=1 Tax=Actinomadura sp. NPDC047616 TaxID=3155914 RepID=UPI0033D59BD0
MSSPGRGSSASGESVRHGRGRWGRRRRPRSSTPRRVVSVAGCGLLVASVTSGCFAEPSAMPTVRDFLIAWEVGNYKAAARKTTGADRNAVAAQLGQLRRQLDAASLRLGLGLPVQPGGTPAKAITKNGDNAVARFAVKIDLGENGQPWTYEGRMRLRRVDGDWKVIWDPSIIHPRLRQGMRLAVLTEVSPRAPIYDSDDKRMLRNVRTDIVGVYPGQLRDPEKTLEQLTKVTKIDGGRKLDTERLVGRVNSAPPERFLPLLTLRHPQGVAIAQRMPQSSGLRVQTIWAPIQSNAAPELVGQLGPATADRLQQVGAPYQPGDTIGVSGIQLLLQRWLAGTPTVRVVAQDPSGRNVQELRSWVGQEPQPVRTTLDATYQDSADQTLARVPAPASMVALRPSTGEVLAVANNKLTGGRNLAMEGSYPPGLTFGIVSAEALLQRGLTKNTQTECPATATVGGQTFSNPGGQARGKRTLQMNFAYSCATTLAQLSTRLDAATLMAEAQRFGLGKDWGLTVPAFTGTVPKPRNDAEKAAIAIGQGGVRVSPLAMALVAGAVDVGSWRPPYLLRSPQDPSSRFPAQTLPSVATSDLKDLVRRSVFQGTARAAEVSSGGKVSGVYATATYTENGREKVVSWFVGSRSGTALAIAVEGHYNAAQLASTFFRGGIPAAPTGASR